MRVRPYEHGDAPGLRLLKIARGNSWTVTVERLVRRVLPALLAERDEGLRALVAEADDGSLVGVVAWQPVAERRMTAAVRVLAVDKRFGDRGIGSGLLLQCLESARADGVADLVGDFHRCNAKVESRLRAANAVIEDDPEDGEFRLFLIRL